MCEVLAVRLKFESLNIFHKSSYWFRTLEANDDNSDWDTPSNFNHERDINEPKTSVMEKEDQGVDSCTDPPHSSTTVMK